MRIVMSNTAVLVYDARADLGEGPIWHSPTQLLYWVNILSGQLNLFDPNTGHNRTIVLGQPVGTVVPRKAGGVMVALQNGLATLDLDTEELTIVHDPEAHLPGNRFNDGKCDPAGRFWAGTMSLNAEDSLGSLYCMDIDHSVRRALGNVTISNGLVWSHDHSTMYFIDSATRMITAFDYDEPTGSISNRRTAITIPPGIGVPDGMTIDAEGMVWIAHFGGSRVTRWNPTNGVFLSHISVPATQVTACAFGGPDLDRLYITTARIDLNADALLKQPDAGGLFVVSPGVKGVKAFEFAG